MSAGLAVTSSINCILTGSITILEWNAQSYTNNIVHSVAKLGVIVSVV